jgi:thiamine-phosphate pyrophosphorylase
MPPRPRPWKGCSPTETVLLPRLLLITDRRRTPQRLTRAVEAALAALPPRSAMILLREKDLAGRELLELAKALREITSRHEAPLLISSRWDVALMVEADGVHLGGDAPSFDSVAASCDGRLMIGVSLHGVEEAPVDASYALISPIFPTASKPGSTTRGLVGLRETCARHQGTPVYALGGISKPEQVRECLRAGAYGVAVLSAVLTSTDPGAWARTLSANLLS